MTAFVHPEYVSRHERVERAVSLVQAARLEIGPAFKAIGRWFSTFAENENGINAAAQEQRLWNAALDGENIMADIRCAMKQTTPDRLASC